MSPNVITRSSGMQPARQNRVEVRFSKTIDIRLLGMSLALGLLLLFCARTAGAQGLGTIVGTVTDGTGAVIPNATVKVVNEGTQSSRDVQTNAQVQQRSIS